MRIAFSCTTRSSTPAAAIPTIISSPTANAAAGQILSARLMTHRQQNRPDARSGRSRVFPEKPKQLVAAGAEQLHQHHEQVDEVEIEAQRPHDRLLAAGLVIIALVVHLLDLLRVPRGQTSKDDDADDRDRKLQRRGGKKDV